jgi:hypothetical protein
MINLAEIFEEVLASTKDGSNLYEALYLVQQKYDLSLVNVGILRKMWWQYQAQA